METALVEFETYRVVAHPWCCDVMGHMNARHIYSVFDDAGLNLLGLIGWQFEIEERPRYGWADVKANIEYRHEIRAGCSLQVLSSILEVGKSSFSQRHALRSAMGDTVHAVMTMKTVFFDLHSRVSAPLPPDIRRNLIAVTKSGHPEDMSE